VFIFYSVGQIFLPYLASERTVRMHSQMFFKFWGSLFYDKLSHFFSAVALESWNLKNNGHV